MADPLYKQIAEDLREKIESGELAAGAQLPTEFELREQYGNASRNTVRDAIKWLTNRGLIRTQAGRGTFVIEKIKPFLVPLNPAEKSPDDSDRFIETAKTQRRAPTVAEPRVEVQNARDEIARELGIEKGSPVVIRHQRRFIDGSPSSLQTSFYPMEFVQQGAVDLLRAVDMPTGATKYIEEKLGIRPAGYRDRLMARPLNPGEVSFFKLPDTGSVLVVVVRRTVYARTGTAIRFTATVYPSDRNDFVIEFGAVPPLLELKRDL